MIIKVVLYFDVPGSFSVTEGNEIVRDLRTTIYKYLIASPIKKFNAKLFSGRKIDITLISEDDAKRRVNQSLKVKIDDKSWDPLKVPSPKKDIGF